jgi:hypothetical protein
MKWVVDVLGGGGIRFHPPGGIDAPGQRYVIEQKLTLNTNRNSVIVFRNLLFYLIATLPGGEIGVTSLPVS